MIITIKKIETKQSSKGTFWRVETDQGWFSVFDQHLGPVLVPSQWDIEWEQKGEFKHIISGKRLNGPVPPAPLPPGKEAMHQDSQKDKLIIREVALKAAVELCTGLVTSGKLQPVEGERLGDAVRKAILKTAEEFEAWICRV